MKYLISICLLLGAVSCTTQMETASENVALSAVSGTSALNQKLQKTKLHGIDLFFEKSFDLRVKRRPEFQTYLGLKMDSGELNDYSEKHQLESLEITKKQLKELRTFDFDSLNHSQKLSYRIFEQNALNYIDDFKYRHHSYPINQMFGIQSELPSFMINTHNIKSKSDALDYISRLNGFTKTFDQIIEGMKTSEKKGIIPPSFVFPKALRDSKNIISGKPFTQADFRSPLAEDFHNKIASLKNLNPGESKALQLQANTALLNSVLPAYNNLIQFLVKLETKSNTKAGAWKLPKGDEYYKVRLQRSTTTSLSPTEIHDLGLREVARIHSEMNKIKSHVGFKGNLQKFFKYIQTDKQFQYPNTAEGRKSYLKATKDIIAGMNSRLDSLFIVKPKSPLKVKAVEAFREKSAGLAFYQGPSLYGNRPGIYYVNLFNMKAVSIPEMEALAYHEAIPGHHMQISITKELKGIPDFRKFSRFTAFTEGWGLYAEYIPKELGLYKDPYSDFGRLSMELLRACRLVVDTGLHNKRWTREQGIAYLNKNTPNSKASNIKSVERYIVLPAQATAYKVGMLKILELRKWSRAQLKDKFDVRHFHNEVLKYGPLPLNILEENIHRWVSLIIPEDYRSPAQNPKPKSDQI